MRGSSGPVSRREIISAAALLPLGACASHIRQPMPARARDWAMAIGAFEHADSARSGLFPTFTPFAGAAAVADVQKLGETPGLWNAAFDTTGRGFALHGVIGGVEGVTGPMLSAFDPATMAQRARVRLPMPDDSLSWIYPGGVAVHANGYVYAAYATRIAKLDPTTLEVRAVIDLPKPNGADGTAYNGFIVLSDGVILAKSHHRKAACPSQGYRALIECGVDGLPASAIVLLDPDDLSIRWGGVAPELIGGRVSSTVWRGREYVYLAGATDLHRMIYRNGVLTPDSAWGPVRYRRDAETPGTAAVAFGGYVAIQNNALPTRAPLRVSLISQDNSARIHEASPFADGGVQLSFMPSKPTVDVANNRIYTGDAHGGLAALDFDPARGLSRAWVQPYRTGSFLTLVGPPDARVLIISDIGAATYDDLGAPAHTTETCRWLDAATGETLASVGNLPRNFGLTLTPGPGQALFYATRAQGLYRLRPARPVWPGPSRSRT